jgi:hypothetical protein
VRCRITADPRDVVLSDGASHCLVFDGSAESVTAGARIDAIGSGAASELLLSFDTSGTLGSVSFDDEDALDYDAGGPTWTLAYDGSARDANWGPPTSWRCPSRRRRWCSSPASCSSLRCAGGRARSDRRRPPRGITTGI